MGICVSAPTQVHDTTFAEPKRITLQTNSDIKSLLSRREEDQRRYSISASLLGHAESTRDLPRTASAQSGISNLGNGDIKDIPLIRLAASNNSGQPVTGLGPRTVQRSNSIGGIPTNDHSGLTVGLLNISPLSPLSPSSIQTKLDGTSAVDAVLRRRSIATVAEIQHVYTSNLVHGALSGSSVLNSTPIGTQTALATLNNSRLSLDLGKREALISGDSVNGVKLDHSLLNPRSPNGSSTLSPTYLVAVPGAEPKVAVPSPRKMPAFKIEFHEQGDKYKQIQHWLNGIVFDAECTSPTMPLLDPEPETIKHMDSNGFSPAKLQKKVGRTSSKYSIGSNGDSRRSIQT